MNNKKSNAIVGRNAVRELLRSDRDVDKILIAKGARTPAVSEIVSEAANRGIVISEVPKSKLDELSEGVPHQGIAAFASEFNYSSIEDILAMAAQKNELPLVVIADEINDPHNLGAIIRSAEGAGAHGIIIPKRRSCGLTQTVAKASAGAIEHIPVVKVVNLARTVDQLKENGFWIFAAESNGKEYYLNDFCCPAALILGSEGKGISRILREKSDFTVSIPMFGKVNSFNVSAAAAVILCEAAKQRNKKN